jgi:hypothetical protein
VYLGALVSDKPNSTAVDVNELQSDLVTVAVLKDDSTALEKVFSTSKPTISVPHCIAPTGSVSTRARTVGAT